MNRAFFILSVLLSVAISVAAGQRAGCYRLVSYNVENFFDATHDSLKNDYDFLPTGRYRWSESRFYGKAQQIARVISWVGGEADQAVVVGLNEVENAHCLDVLCRMLRNYGYRYLHFEGPDSRGIDVALLYDPVQFRLIDSAALPVPPDEGPTRDILYAAGVLPTGDTLHVLECHLPSMRGGSEASERKRRAAKAVIGRQVDSLLALHPRALVAVMGDMNCRPAEDLNGLHNRMIQPEQEGHGTHRYRGIWTCLDQIYLSPALDSLADAGIFRHRELVEPDRRYLDVRPKRTFHGFRYHPSGFSDHLPVYLDICLPLR